MGRGIDSLGSTNEVPFDLFIPMLRSYYHFVREGLKIVEHVTPLNSFEVTPNQVESKLN